MIEDTDPFVFSDMPDEAVVAIDQFLETFNVRFQNHYCDQMYRWYQTLDQREHTRDAMASRSLPDPLFWQPGNDRGDDAAVAIADEPSQIVKIRPSN
jgi:hypothetical protein